MNKTILKVGDLIRFHDWGCGGFLFGVIIEYTDDLFASEINIWRPNCIYYLQSHGIDSIEIIDKIEDVKEKELQRFKEFINQIKVNEVYCRFDMVG